MTKMEEIEHEIKKLEEKECLTYDIVNKLATLYIVRDHMAGSGSSMKSPMAAAPAMSNNIMK